MATDVADFARVEDLGDVSRESLMLIAMLCDQIQTLGFFYRKGAWRNDPAEMSVWLREVYGAATGSSRDTYMKDVAIREWMMWGKCTDTLIEVLERDASVYVDRSRIIELAKAHAAFTPVTPEDTARRKSRWHRRNLRKTRGHASVQVQRANRAA